MPEPHLLEREFEIEGAALGFERVEDLLALGILQYAPGQVEPDVERLLAFLAQHVVEAEEREFGALQAQGLLAVAWDGRDTTRTFSGRWAGNHES